MAASRIWLAGLMGAGKSTIGGALAARTGWPHIDNDVELAAATGRPLVTWAPGDALHAAEDHLLGRLVERPGPFIADVPAGTADRPAVLAALRGTGIVAYLRAPVEVLLERCIGTGRLLGEDPRATLAAQWRARDDAYVSAADVVVDATRPAAEQVDLIFSAVDPSEQTAAERRT